MKTAGEIVRYINKRISDLKLSGHFHQQCYLEYRNKIDELKLLKKVIKENE